MTKLRIIASLLVIFHRLVVEGFTTDAIASQQSYTQRRIYNFQINIKRSPVRLEKKAIQLHCSSAKTIADSKSLKTDERSTTITRAKTDSVSLSDADRNTTLETREAPKILSEPLLLPNATSLPAKESITNSSSSPSPQIIQETDFGVGITPTARKADIPSVLPERKYGKGVWVPPSQNLSQRRGKVFEIQKPQDLLDFVIEDERLSVVKVYASWCKTCKVFDIRYRKLASQLSDTFDSSGTSVTSRGRVRFAEMRFDDPNNEEMCRLLNATKLPYIIMYKGSRGKVEEFQCGPAYFQKVIDAVNRFADPEELLNGALNTPTDGTSIAATNATNNLTDTNTLSVILRQKDQQIRQLIHKLSLLEQEKQITIQNMQQKLQANEEYISRLLVEQDQQRVTHKNEVMAASEKAIELQQSLSGIQNQMESLQSQLSINKADFESKRAAYEQEVNSVEAKLAATQLALESSQSSSQAKGKQILELEEQMATYDRERNSLRKLMMLAFRKVRQKFGERLKIFRPVARGRK